MPSKKIIVKTPFSSPICERNCSVEIGQFFIVDDSEWESICGFFKDCLFLFEYHKYHKYWQFMGCSNYNASEFVEKCIIVDKNPSKNVIALIDKFGDKDIIENLMKLINKH